MTGKKKSKNIFWLLILITLTCCQMLDKGQNELIKEYYNPKQSLKVIVFEKLGNATANNSIQLSIQDYNYKLTDREVGNIFIADQFEGFKKSNDSLLSINWLDNQTIEIIYPTSIRTFKTEKLFEDKNGKIKIDYKTTNE